MTIATDRGALPLSGIRVIDLTWVAAGPSAAMQLALQGADVIRIEAADRQDLARIVDNPNKSDPDTGPIYQCLNMNKRNVSIDLKHPDGSTLARRLILRSDLVLESMRPGRMNDLGLDQRALREEKPDLVYASLSGFGQFGPEADYAGYAPVFAAIGGIAHLTGYPDGIPTQSRGTADMRAGVAMLIPVLAALWRAKRTGVGSYIDVAAAETSACLIGASMMDVQMNGRDAMRRGNDDPVLAPHGVYECATDQSFVVIACRDDEDWAGLCSVVPGLSHIGGCDGMRGRWMNRRAIDGVLRSVVRRAHRDEWIEQLQHYGVPAVPCMSNKDLFEDSHLHERGVWVRVDHPVQGDRWAMGSPWSSSRTGRGADAQPAPLLSEHTRSVLTDELGLSSAEVDDLVARRVVHASDRNAHAAE